MPLRIIQGHRGRYQSKARMWLPISDFLSRAVSELSQLIVQILDILRFWATIWGLRDNVRCPYWAHWKARTGLPISVNWTFFARSYGWGATNENRSKIGDFASMRSLWPKISGRRGRPPPIIFAWIVRPMNALQRSHKETLQQTFFKRSAISVNWTFSLGTTAEALWAIIGSKSAI